MAHCHSCLFYNKTYKNGGSWVQSIFYREKNLFGHLEQVFLNQMPYQQSIKTVLLVG